LLRADGKVVPVEETISIHYDTDGNPTSFSITMHDITNRQVAATEQARLLAEVEASYRQYVQQEWEQYLQEQHQGQWHIESKQIESAVSSDLTWLQEEVIRDQATKVVSHRAGNGANFPTYDTETEPAAIVSPISLRGQVIGTLNLQDTAPDRNWSDEEIALVEAVSEQLALTVENLRLFDDTQRRATREQVTRQITDKMHAATDVDAIIQTGLTELAKTLGVSRTYVKLNPGQEMNQPAEPVTPVQESIKFDIDEEEND
jgi:GAF domain-containing protein